MQYRYKLSDGQAIEVGLHNFSTPNKDYVEFIHNNECKKCLLKEENNLRYFSYNNEDIYLKDFLAYSPSELVELVNKGEATQYDLCCTLLRYGMYSVLVKQPKEPMLKADIGIADVRLESYKPFEDKSHLEKIDYCFEIYDNFKLTDCFKIRLIPYNKEHRGIYGSDVKYISSLVDLMYKRKDLYELVVNEKEAA